jgi:hypothetical protein
MKISKNFIKIKKRASRFHHRKSRYEFICMEYALSNATAVDGTNVMWAGSGVGAKVVPGSYIVRFEDKTIIAEAAVEIKLDPRVTTVMLI